MSLIYYIPPLGKKGSVKLKEPFIQDIDPYTVIEVIGIRSIRELQDNGEDPYNTIFSPKNIDEDTFRENLNCKIPIIVLKDFTTDRLYYIPATYIDSIGSINGVKYQESMLAINLGYLPVNYDISKLKDIVIQDIAEITGITSSMEIVHTSGIQMVTEEEHLQYTRKLDANKTIKDSYKLRCKKLEEVNNQLKERIEILKKYILDNKDILHLQDVTEHQ